MAISVSNNRRLVLLFVHRLGNSFMLLTCRVVGLLRRLTTVFVQMNCLERLTFYICFGYCRLSLSICPAVAVVVGEAQRRGLLRFLTPVAHPFVIVVVAADAAIGKREHG